MQKQPLDDTALKLLTETKGPLAEKIDHYLGYALIGFLFILHIGLCKIYGLERIRKLEEKIRTKMDSL